MRVPAWMFFLGAIALVCVTAGVGLVVVSSRSQHVLVREDYYSEGLKLDSHLAREAAFDSLKVRLTLQTEGRALLVKITGAENLSPALRDSLVNLSLVLQIRRPENAADDQDIPLTLASDAPPLWVAHESIREGHWDVRAIFSDSSGPRFEKALTVNRFP